MKKILIFVLAFLYAGNLFANSVEEDILEATNTLEKLTLNKNTIPKKIMQQARAIVVVPSSIKVSFFVGGKYGEGVASIKKANGQWSNPFFVTLGSGSLGFQFGVESADSLFVFRTQNSVDELLKQKFTLGVGASISAGPMGANVEKNSEINMKAEIFSYSQTSGLFVGASFDGASIANNDGKNRALYGGNMSVRKIVKMDNRSGVYSIEQFLKQITNSTSK